MKCLLLLPLFITTVISAFDLYDVELQSPFLKNTLLCRPWNCISEKIGLSDKPLTKEQFTLTLNSWLPEGAWKSTVTDVVTKCFGEKSKRYTNTCPGQELLHCVVDNLNEFCPEENLFKDDACAPLSSIAGFKYMFSQSRYDNLQHYIPTERRPSWFLNNYFSENCCQLPELFNSSILTECGFSSMIHYYGHQPASMKIIAQQPAKSPVSTTTEHEYEEDDDIVDPLDCCDISELISRDIRSNCEFNVTWAKQRRLSVWDQDVPVPTTTSKPVVLKHHDVKVVPLSCEKEICIFSKLDIIKGGEIDMNAYSKLLDNFTRNHPDWRSAKARVETKCITKPLRDYDADCEINKLLACTFDVLSENCPHKNKSKEDPCKHTNTLKNDTICQINSSKYTPRNRRQFCDFPQFVNHEVLAECGASSINRIESVPDVIGKKDSWRPKWKSFFPTCQDASPSTKCVLKNLSVLNKYNFIDYFVFKDRINKFISKNVEWGLYKDIIVNYYNTMPMYREYCTTPKRILNVVDVMLQNCPPIRRKKTKMCSKIFEEMKQLPSSFARKSTPRPDHRQHIFLTFTPLSFPFIKRNHRIPHNTKRDVRIEQKKDSILDHSMLRTANIPPVRIMSIKPYRTYVRRNQKPLVRTPVYMKYAPTISSSVPTEGYGDELKRPFKNDGVWRSKPLNSRGDGETSHGKGNLEAELQSPL